VGSPRGEAPEYGVRLAALALAEALRRLQLDSGFLMCCYSGVWAQPVRHELLVLAHAVDELAVSASVLPIGAAADLARAVGLWKAFHAVASSRSMLEPEPAQPGHWAATTTPRDLLVACREELERFGHGAFAPPDAGHGRLIG
jgi:hypothetical protein